MQNTDDLQMIFFRNGLLYKFSISSHVFIQSTGVFQRSSHCWSKTFCTTTKPRTSKWTWLNSNSFFIFYFQGWIDSTIERTWTSSTRSWSRRTNESISNKTKKIRWLNFTVLSSRFFVFHRKFCLKIGKIFFFQMRIF